MMPRLIILPGQSFPLTFYRGPLGIDTSALGQALTFHQHQQLQAAIATGLAEAKWATQASVCPQIVGPILYSNVS